MATSHLDYFYTTPGREGRQRVSPVSIRGWISSGDPEIFKTTVDEKSLKKRERGEREGRNSYFLWKHPCLGTNRKQTPKADIYTWVSWLWKMGNSGHFWDTVCLILMEMSKRDEMTHAMGTNSCVSSLTIKGAQSDWCKQICLQALAAGWDTPHLQCPQMLGKDLL